MAQTLRRGPVTGTAVRQPAKKRPFVLDLYATAVGKKYVMAITGLIGIAFVVGHMIGNLKMYLGPIMEDGERVYDIDIYGEFLRDLAVPAASPHLPAVGSAARADRRGAPAHPRGVGAHPAQPQGAGREVPVRARLPGRQLRQPHDALDRHRSSCSSSPGTSLDLTWGWLNPEPSGLAATCTSTSTSRCRAGRSPSSTSWPTSRSASTCSTAPGRCSSRWAGTTHVSTLGVATPPSASSALIVVGQLLVPDRGAGRRRRIRPHRHVRPRSPFQRSRSSQPGGRRMTMNARPEDPRRATRRQVVRTTSPARSW